jgi:hypothetical protein
MKMVSAFFVSFFCQQLKQATIQMPSAKADGKTNFR